MKAKQELIKIVNEFLKEKLEDEKMRLMLNGTDFDKLVLKDIVWVKEKTNKYSIGYREYWVLRHIFDVGEDEVKLDIDRNNEFGEMYLADNYTIYRNSETGTEVEDDNMNNEDMGLMSVLNEYGFAEYICEQPLLHDFEQEEIDEVPKKLKETYLKDMPGIVDILPLELDKVELVLSNKVKFRVPVQEIEFGVRYNNK